MNIKTEGYKEGMLARSKAGHDAGRLYMIIRTEEEYVYLADGRLRTLDRLKKKKKKHVQIINREYDTTDLTDIRIKQLLKED